ncbi:hypothetical protein KC717_05240 [Candidatus Dojkabacteria bacterium]|uniref:Phosphoribosyl-ATP diphosphatase n=1 Tax=Candidatus Dojkabacteria bacterium TaxID=2099670 RepID=A0A955L9J4_9BACT|nr:hypothetical protein [Candidatus Dojkabacteria bacterium]
MKQQLDQITEFHKAFGSEEEPDSPTLSISHKIKELRKTLMKEEFEEVCKAIDENEPIEDLAKELADLLYVVFGTVKAFGLHDVMEDVYSEVHRSNMSKLGLDGKPVIREDGKTLKGPNYSPANISPIIKK